MCLIHKGFSGFRALSPTLILVRNLIGLRSPIKYLTESYTRRMVTITKNLIF